MDTRLHVGGGESHFLVLIPNFHTHDSNDALFIKRGPTERLAEAPVIALNYTHNNGYFHLIPMPVISRSYPGNL